MFIGMLFCIMLFVIMFVAKKIELLEGVYYSMKKKVLWSPILRS